MAGGERAKDVAAVKVVVLLLWLCAMATFDGAWVVRHPPPAYRVCSRTSGLVTMFYVVSRPPLFFDYQKNKEIIVPLRGYPR